MSNDIEFHVPKPAPPAFSFGLKPKAFCAQFHHFATLPLPAPDDPFVVAAAADCGYGLAAGMRITATPKTWNALLQYLDARRALISTLFEKVPPGPGAGIVRRAAFTRVLESSEKTPSAFALGMIYARVATEQWQVHHGAGAPPCRFWHYTILCDPAVSLVGGGPAWNVDSPDFFVEDSAGNWSVVESKGTLDGFRSARLYEGMKQAHKFSSITVVDPSGPPASPQALVGRMCSLAYVDASGQLQVRQLARSTGTAPHPAVVGAPPAGSVGHGPVVFAKGGDLVRFEQALRQWTSQAASDAPPLTDGGISWRRSRQAPGHRLGVLTVHAQRGAALQWAVEALRLVIPAIAEARTSGKEEGGLVASIATLATTAAFKADAGPGDSREVEAWRALALWLSEVLRRERHYDWRTLLSDFWEAPLWGDATGAGEDMTLTSLAELWEAISPRIIQYRSNLSRQRRLAEGLPPAEGALGSTPGVVVRAITAHGLLVDRID